MKKFLLGFSCVMMGLISCTQTLPEKLDQYLAAAEKAGIFNGTVLITKGNGFLVNKGYGYKNVDTKTLNDANTIFQIGSVTKQFTAAVILKLVEQRKLSLSDKLSKYFPGFPHANSITIENLLSHTSGLYNYTNDGNFMQNEVEKTLSREQFIQMIKDKPLDFTPGSKYNYSNSGYMFLGYIIEDITKKKYEQVVREQIFNPLGMSHSGFDFRNLRSVDRAVGYNAIVEGVGSKAQVVDSTVSFAAGAIYTTTGNLYKWNQSVLTERILKKSSLENAFTPRLSGYGLGWVVTNIDDKKAIMHDGGIHGFTSSNIIIPSDSITVTIITNSGSSKMGQVGKELLAILFNKPYTIPEKKKEVKLDAMALAQFVGEYELAPTFKITITIKNDALVAQATGQPPFDLFAKSENVFFVKVVDAEVEFVKNDKGEVVSLILHQGGQNIPGKKIK